MNYYDLANKYREAIIKTTCALVEIPSVKQEAQGDAPYGPALKECLHYILDLGQSSGFVANNYDNYIGELLFGAGKEIVGVACHLDVVPANGKDWSFPPFAPFVKDGIIFGRGSNDNKGPTAAAFFAMLALKESGFQPKKQLKMLFGCDEESGMSDIDYYKEKVRHLPTSGFATDCTFPVNYGEHSIYILQIKIKLPDYILFLTAGDHYGILAEFANASIKDYPANIKELFDFFLTTNAYSGKIEFSDDLANIELQGVPAHASRPYVGHSAATGLCTFLAALYNNEDLLDLSKGLDNWLGRGLGINYKSERYGELYCSFTKIESQQRDSSFYLSLRYPANLIGKDITAKIIKRFSTNKLIQEIRVLEDRPGYYTDPNGKLVQTLETVYRRQSGDNDSESKVSPGGTYARKFEGFVAFGPTTKAHLADKRMGQAHQADEGMEIETLIKGCAVYIEALWQLLSDED